MIGNAAKVAGLRDRLLVLALLVLAAVLCLRGINFGLPALNDSDELMFELGAVRMLRGPTLNPGWFGHPATTTMYLLAVINALVFLTGHLFGWFGSVRGFADAIYADPTWVILPGRVAMALFAVGTVFLVWRLGSTLFGRRAGFAAALLLAINPVHITYAQIIRSDMMACFFMLLVILAAVRIARDGRWRDYVLAAFWLGLVVATKWPFALCALPVAGAIGLRVARAPAARRTIMLRHEAQHFVLLGLMAIGFLLLASPYLLLDYQTVVRNLLGEAQPYHLGATGGTPLANAWWYLAGPIYAGLGAAGLGLVAVGIARLRRHREAAAILLPLIFAWFALICAQHLLWERWALPLMPLLVLCAGPVFAGLDTFLRDRLTGWLGWIARALLVAVVCVPLLLLGESNRRERTNDTRQLASAWARAHIPAGSTVLIEHFAFDLVDAPWQFRYPLAETGCVDARAMLQGKISYAMVDSARGARHNVDYGTMSAGRRASCRFDYAILTQMDRYRAEAAMFPAEDAAYRDLLRRGRVVASFVPRAGQSGRWTVRIVRMNPDAWQPVQGSDPTMQDISERPIGAKDDRTD